MFLIRKWKQKKRPKMRYFLGKKM